MTLVHDLAFWNLFFYGGMPYSAFKQGGGAWSCLNLICQALLTPKGGPILSEWRQRKKSGQGWQCRRKIRGGNRKRGGRGNSGWNVK